jgi:alkanesulfonate monooxygenase SsuD/methylene tetrahydromethanopterin reductase-like flavin-dependent oxidoreductase (luciferase family)
MSEGRFVLGVGAGNLHFNDLYMGIDSSKPLTKMRDFMTIFCSVVFGKSKDPVRYKGKAHRIRWRATWDPAAASVPVYLSASSPKIVFLVGEVSIGVGVGTMSSVAFVRDIVQPNA